MGYDDEYTTKIDKTAVNNINYVFNDYDDPTKIDELKKEPELLINDMMSRSDMLKIFGITDPEPEQPPAKPPEKKPARRRPSSQYYYHRKSGTFRKKRPL